MLLRDDSPYFSDEHRMIREQIRRFVAERVIPHGDAWEEAGCIPRDVFREMGELGLFGMRIPTEYGGSGLDTMASVVLGEELGQSTFGGLTGSVLAHTDMAVPHLTRFGTPEQKEKFLPGIIAGTTIGAITVSEPDAGSDTARLRTRAVRDGDHYVLNGAKTFHHQRRAWGPAVHSSADRPRRPMESWALHVHSRAPEAGRSGEPRAQEDWMALLGYGGDCVRGLLRSRESSVGGREQGILLYDGELPDRADRHRSGGCW